MSDKVIKQNGKDRRQAEIDARELVKHFDTAIDAMEIIYHAIIEGN